MRHASTASTGVVPAGGDDPGPPLSPAGLLQAQALRLDADVLLTSPMTRCVQTARALGPEPVVAPEWSELRLGEWNGLSYREIAARWPAEYTAWRESPAARPPGGESVHDLSGRTDAAVHLLRSSHPGRVVAVVTHTGPIRAVVASALEAGPAAFWRLRIDPASVTTLRFWADGGVEVVGVNSLITHTNGSCS
ncbi:histidine phosphatase family protein [Kineosporia succinea]|uniref:Broad specificity phosphatase PhoE n=1 Tax=Kineosporia succinea TaxID=84632 RepID=A0ABT9P6H6_9ACTN|nr:histidine phosphatase family protein [Kineosporia succinea]MDP9828166.1 broad specificity phosphatase PhoE [Kineosporia succinea]